MAALHRPSVAMLDISMPDMTGWEVVRRLRSDAASAAIKIVMISANAHEYSPGGDGGPLHDAFLVKPIDVDVLLQCVGSLLQLEWIHEAPTETVVPALPVIEPTPVHCRHHIGELYELGRIGHVRGIEAKLREIEAEHPANAPFAAHLRGLIASFNMKRYMTVLDAIRKEGRSNHA
jgi:DNA-binding response OmpR family regulator